MSNLWTSDWSEAAADNTAASPDGWATGMSPGTVKDCAREMMAAIKRNWNLDHPTLTAGGTGTAYTLSPTTALDAYVTGQIFAIKLNADLGASATLNVSSKGARKIYLPTSAGLVQPSGGEAKSGHRVFCYYDAALDSSAGGFVIFAGLPQQPATEVIAISVTADATAVTSGTAKATFRMPYAFTLTDVRASLVTAQASGTILTIDINEAGSTILSTKLTIDNTEKTSTTAATPAVISDASLADDALMTIDIDSIGNGSAQGLKVYLIGRKP